MQLVRSSYPQTWGLNSAVMNAYRTGWRCLPSDLYNSFYRPLFGTVTNYREWHSSFCVQNLLDFFSGVVACGGYGAALVFWKLFAKNLHPRFNNCSVCLPVLWIQHFKFDGRKHKLSALHSCSFSSVVFLFFSFAIPIFFQSRYRRVWCLHREDQFCFQRKVSHVFWHVA